MDKENLAQAAEAFIVADDRLREIGEGVGGLAYYEPELMDNWREWNRGSDYDHADTVLDLLAKLEQQASVVKTLAERNVELTKRKNELTLDLSRCEDASIDIQGEVNELNQKLEQAEAQVARVRELANEANQQEIHMKWIHPEDILRALDGDTRG